MAGVFRMPDAMWERIRPLVPVPEKVFEALWRQALADYDAGVGLDWAWLSIDGAMGKARCSWPPN